MRTPPRSALSGALAAALLLPALGACSDYGGYGDRPGYAGGPYGGDGYYLRDNDQIYRDRDGRYYCRKPDGTTGALVGGVTGGVLGNIIAPGGSKTLGTILGAAGGALAGQAIDKNNVRCR